MKNLGVGEMLKLGAILVAYAVASCTVLAIVNNFTAPKILQNKIETANKAMKEVFVQADSFETISNFNPSSNKSITISDVYLAKNGDKVIGSIAQISGPTYDQGKIILGIGIDGKIAGMRILELSDSPGFGLKANDPSFKLESGMTFYDQFTGKSSEKSFVPGENFDAISGATITSKAIGDLITEGAICLNKCLENYNE